MSMTKKKTNPFLKGGTVATLCFGLVLSFCLVSIGCNKSKDPLIENGDKIQPNPISIWECVPVQNPDIIITLTIDSEKNEARISSCPQDFQENSSWDHMLHDKTQFIIVEDTLYIAEYYPEHKDFSFARTMLSSDSMKLEYLGITIAVPSVVTDYLFTFKKN